MSMTINTPVEWALYWLAIQHPDVLTFAEQTRGTKMVANDQDAARRVKALLESR